MKKTFAAILMILLMSAVCFAQDITLAWDLSTSDDGSAGGYRIYLSKQSGNYTDIPRAEVAQGVSTVTFDVSDLRGRYYFVATFYLLENGEVIESDHSNEITAVFKPNPPENLRKVD